MRRIALEISSTGRTGADSLFEKIVELEIIHNLRSDSNGIAGIWKIVLKDPRASPRTPFFAQTQGIGGPPFLVSKCFRGDRRELWPT